jgi:glycosyltransferase involved in cell wall biosynthesis
MFRDNFLRAAELCTGELIAFCDQDDVWHPDKLLRCAKEFAAPAVALTVHSARIWHGDGDFRGRLPHFRSRRHYEKRGIDPFVTYPGFAIMFRRDLLDITDNFARPDYILPSGGQYQKMAHDQWVFFLASIFGEIVTLPDVLADYRQHDSNTFGATAKPKMSENLRSSITTVSYAGIAQRFSQLADFMRAIARTAPPAHRDAALQAAARFARRAEFNARRDGLYRIDTTLPHRLAAFGKMLADGLYTPDQSSTHPTQGAVLKDLCFAIPGFHKYIVKTRSAEYPARG